MKIKYLIIFSLFCLSLPNLMAQVKSSYSKKTQEETYLEEARRLREKNPEKAIKLLEKAIRSSKRTSNYAVDAEAYFLLGNIYEDIGQNDLALQRYIRASRLFELTEMKQVRAQNYYRMGLLQLSENQEGSARESFTFCRDFATENDLKNLCSEGLASVSFKEENFDEGFTILEEVGDASMPDSLTRSRVEAQKADAYIQQNDYSNARAAYEYSVNSIPQTRQKKEAKAKDFEYIEQTKEKLIQMQPENEAEEIEIRQLNANALAELEIPNSNYITENLKLADIYVRNNELEKAAEYVKKSELKIDESTGAVSIAEVFKKSSEIKNKLGDFAEAAIDYDRYIAVNDIALKEKEADLIQQIEIVKNQQSIDLLEKDFVLEEKEKMLLESQLSTQKIIIGLLSLLLVGAGVFFYFLWRNVKARRRANQMLLLKSLRTQMNPHFIFNALNSVNNFIAKNDEKAANKFLSEFSRLMRKVLDYSQQDFISLSEEVELNELYLKLEHFRFRDKFDFEFTKDIEFDGQEIEVPPMLVQPFIENAVWHGLRYKKGKGKLLVNVSQNAENLIVIVKDDGIGRAKSKELKTQNQRNYKSTGLANVERRIDLINEIYGKNYAVEIRDLEVGTEVEIRIPTGN
jgi:two-component system LytT family sensor kinase